MSRLSNVLKYLGVRSKNPPSFTKAAVDPGVANKDFNPGDIWWNSVTNIFSMFSGISGGNAVWTRIGGSTAGAGSFTTLATSGDYTATTGNIIINSAGRGLRIHGGAATDTIGTATLVNGAATIANTNIAATDRIFVERSAANASTAFGVFNVAKSAGVNFVITSSKADTTTETGDQSTVEYVIIRQV